jgi:hypothetical protein
MLWLYEAAVPVKLLAHGGWWLDLAFSLVVAEDLSPCPVSIAGAAAPFPGLSARCPPFPRQLLVYSRVASTAPTGWCRRGAGRARFPAGAAGISGAPSYRLGSAR